MQVRVNGTAQQLPEATTVAQLLQTLAVDPQLVAVELNEAVVRRARHSEVKLSDGDRVEIVTFVGGG